MRRQSEHRPAYDAALETLRGQGVLYRCFRTRKELMALAGAAPHGDDPADAQAFRGQALAIRFKVQGANVDPTAAIEEKSTFVIPR